MSILIMIMIFFIFIYLYAGLRVARHHNNSDVGLNVTCPFMAFIEPDQGVSLINSTSFLALAIHSGLDLRQLYKMINWHDRCYDIIPFSNSFLQFIKVLQYSSLIVDFIYFHY